jgi:hypothetical protein
VEVYAGLDPVTKKRHLLSKSIRPAPTAEWQD